MLKKKKKKNLLERNLKIVSSGLFVYMTRYMRLEKVK